MTRGGDKNQGTKSFLELLVIKSLFIAFVFVLPLIAHAKIVSMVSVLLNGPPKEENLQDSPNSQKMSLLQAAVAPNPSVGGGDISIIDGNSLLSETGPTNGNGLFQESGQISVYVVREGDTLSQIAQMFGVSVNTIRWGNDIKGSIQPGQSLVILPVSGVKHIIKSGDTLDSIAKKYKGDAEEIMFYNNLPRGAKLSVAEEIIIPNGIIPGAPSPSPAPKASSQATAPSSSAAPAQAGYYIRPIAGGVRSQGPHGYRSSAVDLAAPAGTPIMAAASGVVTVSRHSGWNGGYGNYIVISHPNGTQTLYAHNRQNFVSSGQQVSQGEIIAEVGSTGQSTGPHLHIEVRGARNPF